jgi:hypothetical protein
MRQREATQEEIDKMKAPKFIGVVDIAATKL